MIAVAKMQQRRRLQAENAALREELRANLVAAQNRAINDTEEYVGRTVALNDVSLRAQVEGYLLARSFEEGDDIEAGSELFVIDPAGIVQYAVLHNLSVGRSPDEVLRVLDALQTGNGAYLTSVLVPAAPLRPLSLTRTPA